jgi:iron complex transport system substrate-binding protein
MLALAGMFICTPARAEVYKDALERSIYLEQTPHRVVSLVPSVTETIYALDAQEQLIGVTDFCNYPEQAAAKPSVGAYNSPSIESIALLEPDLVIIAADMATPAMLDNLLKLKIPVYAVYPRSLEATIAMLRGVGKLLGHAERGETLAYQLQSRVEQLQYEVEQAQLAHAPRVMISIMVEPLVIAGVNTLPGEMLECAGGMNIAGNGSRYPMWNMETVLAHNPDIIIVSPHPGTSSPQNFFQRFSHLRAVQNDMVISIPADWLQRPGPRVLKGLNALREAILKYKHKTEMQDDAGRN